MKKFWLAGIFISLSYLSVGQTCTSNPTTIGSSTNFSALSWTSTGGATCPPSGSFTGNVVIDMANNVTVTMNQNLTISGNFTITNSGNSYMTVPAGVSINVGGDMGHPDNNSVQYTVDGSLHVAGTLYGKNNNAFVGSGTITGGTLNVKNGTSCGSPCPVSGGFQNCTATDGFCTTNNVTPIILSNFGAKAGKESVVLEWTTMMEENFREFVVQRSKTGVGFHDLAKVAGAGRNIFDLESHYAYEDKAPFVGLNYYRLKAVDIDDQFEYFDIVSVNFEGNKEFVVYPNPGNGDNLSFRTNFIPGDNDRIVVTNHLGIQIASVSAINGGAMTFSSKLFAGVYMVKYVGSDFEKVVKVVVKN